MSTLLSFPRVSFLSQSVWADQWNPTGEPPSPPKDEKESPRPAHNFGTSHFPVNMSLRASNITSPSVASPQSAKRPRSISPAPPHMSPKNRFPVAFPITPTRSTRGQDPKTPSSAFTPSQRQRRLEHIIAGMAESPQRRANTGVPHSPVSHDWHDVVPELSYAATSRSGRQFSGTTSLQGPSNYDQYDGTSLPSPSPSKRSRYSEIGSLYSVGIQTSPRPQSLLDDGSEHAVEVELEFAPDNSFGSVAGTSRDRLPAAFPLPGTSTLRASPSHHRESMMPGDRSQGYLTPPKSSELHSDERPLSRQGSFAPAGSPAQQNGNGRKAGARPHPQWQFEEDTVSVSLSLYD